MAGCSIDLGQQRVQEPCSVPLCSGARRCCSLCLPRRRHPQRWCCRRSSRWRRAPNPACPAKSRPRQRWPRQRRALPRPPNAVRRLRRRLRPHWTFFSQGAFGVGRGSYVTRVWYGYLDTFGYLHLRSIADTHTMDTPVLHILLYCTYSPRGSIAHTQYSIAFPLALPAQWFQAVSQACLDISGHIRPDIWTLDMSERPDIHRHKPCTMLTSQAMLHAPCSMLQQQLSCEKVSC